MMFTNMWISLVLLGIALTHGTGNDLITFFSNTIYFNKCHSEIQKRNLLEATSILWQNYVYKRKLVC